MCVIWVEQVWNYYKCSSGFIIWNMCVHNSCLDTISIEWLRQGIQWRHFCWILCHVKYLMLPFLLQCSPFLIFILWFYVLFSMLLVCTTSELIYQGYFWILKYYKIQWLEQLFIRSYKHSLKVITHTHI